MRKIFLDIETIPAGEENFEKLRYLYEKKKKEDESFEDFVGRTGLDGTFGRILCIGYAVDDGEMEIFYNENNERETLVQFWDLVSSISISPRNMQYPDYGVLFVGHNVMDFDLRFIYQRSIVLGVKPAYDINFARYRNYPIFDTMKEWVKWSNSAVGLEALALALDIPSPKDGIDGSQVYNFYKNGKIKDILEYCKRDVDTTREVYRKMIFEKKQTLF